MPGNNPVKVLGFNQALITFRQIDRQKGCRKTDTLTESKYAVNRERLGQSVQLCLLIEFGEGLLEVPDDIVCILRTDGEANR